jgi:hypothetical protein
VAQQQGHLLLALRAGDKSLGGGTRFAHFYRMKMFRVGTHVYPFIALRVSGMVEE